MTKYDNLATLVYPLDVNYTASVSLESVSSKLSVSVVPNKPVKELPPEVAGFFEQATKDLVKISHENHTGKPLDQKCKTVKREKDGFTITAERSLFPALCDVSSPDRQILAAANAMQDQQGVSDLIAGRSNNPAGERSYVRTFYKKLYDNSSIKFKFEARDIFPSRQIHLTISFIDSEGKELKDLHVTEIMHRIGGRAFDEARTIAQDVLNDAHQKLVTKFGQHNQSLVGKKPYGLLRHGKFNDSFLYNYGGGGINCSPEACRNMSEIMSENEFSLALGIYQLNFMPAYNKNIPYDIAAENRRMDQVVEHIAHIHGLQTSLEEPQHAEAVSQQLEIMAKVREHFTHLQAAIEKYGKQYPNSSTAKLLNAYVLGEMPRNPLPDEMQASVKRFADLEHIAIANQKNNQGMDMDLQLNQRISESLWNIILQSPAQDAQAVFAPTKPSKGTQTKKVAQRRESNELTRRESIKSIFKVVAAAAMGASVGRTVEEQQSESKEAFVKRCEALFDAQQDAPKLNKQALRKQFGLIYDDLETSLASGAAAGAAGYATAEGIDAALNDDNTADKIVQAVAGGLQPRIDAMVNWNRKNLPGFVDLNSTQQLV